MYEYKIELSGKNPHNSLNVLVQICLCSLLLCCCFNHQVVAQGYMPHEIITANMVYITFIATYPSSTCKFAFFVLRLTVSGLESVALPSTRNEVLHEFL